LRDVRVSYYLFIDEYDNFANNILMQHGRLNYRDVTHAGGFLRSFFAVIKNGTENRVIERMFVTGVSPLVLSNVTSGMNIGDNISTLKMFSTMVGLTEEEVEQLIDYYISEGVVGREEKEELFQIIKDYSNNYAFSRDLSRRVYNTDIVMYIMNQVLKGEDFRENPIDHNIRTDYEKLRFLVIENNRLNGNFNILQEIVDTGETKGTLVDSFSIEELIDSVKFISLLYYLGLITIREHYPGGFYEFMIPNLTVNTLLWEYIREAISDAYADLRIDVKRLGEMFRSLAFEGEWKPLFEYLLSEFYRIVSSRDFIWKEEGVKMFLMTYLSVSPLYIVESEYDTGGGYSDIYLRKNWAITDLTEYEYLIEIKHVRSGKRGIGKERVRKLREEAEEQIRRYAEKLERKLPPYVKDRVLPELKKIVIITSSKRVEWMGEVE